MSRGSASTDLRIFLNYRRSDTADATDRLYDALAARFGDDHVFMDIDAIEPGLDFRKVITQAVDSCDVCLAVIGRQWLTAADATGRRRLDRSDDFVRMELQAALERDVRVVPVLVQDVEDMPSADELPEGLKELAWRNAHKMRRESWSHDLGRLIHALERIAAAKTRERPVADPPVAAGDVPPAAEAVDAAVPAESAGARPAAPPTSPVPAPVAPHRRPRASRRVGAAAATCAGVAAVVAVVVAASSGGGGSQPGDVVAANLSALASGDYGSICRSMTPSAGRTAVESSFRPNCPLALRAAFATGVGAVIRRLAGQASVGRTQGGGTAASVTVSAPYRGSRVSFIIPLVRQRGAWKIDETTADAFARDVKAFTTLQS